MCNVFSSVEIHDCMSAANGVVGTQAHGVNDVFYGGIGFDAIKGCLAKFTKHTFKMFIAINGWFVYWCVGTEC